MTDRQNAKFTMYQAVHDVCVENASAYAQVQAFVDEVAELHSNIARIRIVEQQRLDAQSKGLTSEKTALKEQLVTAALKVAGALYAYSAKNNKPDITAKVNFSRSVMSRMEDNALSTVANEISILAQFNISEITPYGIQMGSVDDLRLKIMAYEAMIVKPRVAIGEHRIATENLAQAFRDTDTLLFDGLDKLIILFAESNPDFYNNYRLARNIINTSSRRRKAEAVNPFPLDE